MNIKMTPEQKQSLRDVGQSWMSETGRDALDDWLDVNVVEVEPLEPTDQQMVIEMGFGKVRVGTCSHKGVLGVMMERINSQHEVGEVVHQQDTPYTTEDAHSVITFTNPESVMVIRAHLDEILHKMGAPLSLDASMLLELCVDGINKMLVTDGHEAGIRAYAQNRLEVIEEFRILLKNNFAATLAVQYDAPTTETSA